MNTLRRALGRQNWAVPFHRETLSPSTDGSVAGSGCPLFPRPTSLAPQFETASISRKNKAPIPSPALERRRSGRSRPRKPSETENESWLTGGLLYSPQNCTAGPGPLRHEQNRNFSLRRSAGMGGWGREVGWVQFHPEPFPHVQRAYWGVLPVPCQACTASPGGHITRGENLADNGFELHGMGAPARPIPPHAGQPSALGLSCFVSHGPAPQSGPYVTKKSGELTLAEAPTPYTNGLSGPGDGPRSAFPQRDQVGPTDATGMKTRPAITSACSARRNDLVHRCRIREPSGL